MLVWQENTCEPHFLHYSKRCPTHAHIVQQGHHRWAPSDDEKVRERKNQLSLISRTRTMHSSSCYPATDIDTWYHPQGSPSHMLFLLCHRRITIYCLFWKDTLFQSCWEKKTAKWKLCPFPLIFLSFSIFGFLSLVEVTLSKRSNSLGPIYLCRFFWPHVGE